MNILIDQVPDSISINGAKYQINTNFRAGILFELMFEDTELDDIEIIYNALELYFDDNIPGDIKLAIEAIRWFYGCGKEIKASEGQKAESSPGKKIYSFEHDADFIYSAFLTQYRLDLQDIEHLHWWKFRAMFNALSEGHLFSKIMGYRAMTIDKDMSPREKKFYKEMKRQYALPDSRSLEEKEAGFHQAMSSMV